MSVIEQAQQFITQGQLSAAEDILTKATQTNPQDAAAFQKLGVAVALQGRRTEAITLFEKAIEIKPDFALAYNGLALALSEESRLQKAEENCLKGLEADKNCLPLYSTYAKTLKAQSRLEDAEETLLAGLALAPNDLQLLVNLGAISGELRKKDEAIEYFEAASKLQPLNMELHDFIAGHKKYNSADDPHIIQMETYLSDPRIQGRNLANLHFALAEAYEKINKTDQAFDHYKSANQNVHNLAPYDHTATQNLFQPIKNFYNEPFFEKNRNEGIDDSTPIFIIGMPRSGTSLAEQILASHSDVFGAGELKDIELVQQQERGIKNIAERYLEHLKQYAPEAKHIVDKMPHNFRYLGLIQTMLPKAKIIHCTRNKNDVMWSIYKCNFKGNLPFAFDFNAIEQFYEAYDDLMHHWKNVLPHPILELRYEDLIERQEEQTKRLLDFCNLDWQDNCLEFHKIKRSVTTASAGQVQQPLYKTAVNSWKKYEGLLPEDIFSLTEVK